jgi:hypothetical protein
MNTKLCIVIEINEIFNIPINQLSENKLISSLSRSNIITNFDSELIHSLGILPTISNQIFEPPKLDFNIKLVGIYSNKERACQIIRDYPNRQILVSTSIIQD